MRKPIVDAERDIIEALADAREERIAKLAKISKKGRVYAARYFKF